MNSKNSNNHLFIHKVFNKSLLLLVVGLSIYAINNYSFAQEDTNRKLRIGLGTGFGFSWFKPDNAVKANDAMTKNGVKLSYNFGVMMDYKFGANYAFSTGIYLSKTGGNIKYGQDTIPTTDKNLYAKATSKYSYSINNIEIPLLLKLNTNEIGYLTYFGQVGFGVNMRTKTSGSISYENLDPTSSSLSNNKPNNLDLSNQIAFFRTSLIFGGGVEYNLSGNTSLVLGIQFKSGLTNAFSKKVNKNTYNKLMANSNLQKSTSSADSFYEFKDNTNKKYTGLSKKAMASQFVITVGIFF